MFLGAVKKIAWTRPSCNKHTTRCTQLKGNHGFSTCFCRFTSLNRQKKHDLFHYDGDWNHGILWPSIQLGISSYFIIPSPKWRTLPSFFRGVGQPPTSWLRIDSILVPILGVSIAGKKDERWGDHGPSRNPSGIYWIYGNTMFSSVQGKIIYPLVI
jgi:hypothetical protein